MRKRSYFFRFLLSIGLIAACAGCEDMLDVAPNRSLVDKPAVFSSDASATAAVTAVYSAMYTDTRGFASGSVYSVASLAGLSADELVYGSNNVDFIAFSQYNILAKSPVNLGLWISFYRTIYLANNALEGLNEGKGMTPDVRARLEGECLFVRSFCYFYLVNVFGDVPLLTTTGFDANSVSSRTDVSDIYNRIVDDLLMAVSLLPDDYATTGRVRPNKAAASSLLARIYLYLGEWGQAEAYATTVIQDSRYLLSDLSEVFLNSSTEAIWQLMPMGQYKNTNEGNLFVLYAPAVYPDHPFSLSNELVSSFEEGDNRKDGWVGKLSFEGQDYYYPYKYKIRDGGSLTVPVVELTEYSMVLRLAEQYLIRAEAGARLGNKAGAGEDLNVIRTRAGLSSLDIDAVSEMDLDSILALIERERRVELFSEWGHRWFDLKRTDRADEVLGTRPNWTTNAELYPIPEEEIRRNPALNPQNFGY